MDETMNEDTSGWRELGRFTASTGGTDSIPYLNFGSSTMASFTATTNDTDYWTITVSDKDWMPYKYVEYEPIWHKKFARYKLQMQSMWD